MIRLITLVLKVAVLPVWVFKTVSEYATTVLHVNPVIAFAVSAAAVFGSLSVALKLPI